MLDKEMKKKKKKAKKKEETQNRKAKAGLEFEYSESLESTDILNLKDQYSLFIGGKFVKPNSNKYFPTMEKSLLKSLMPTKKM